MCDICQLYHGPLILKASCVFGELRCVPCVPRKCCLNKTSLESCRNLFAGFHVDAFRWWSWEHPKTDMHLHPRRCSSVVSNCQSSAKQRRQRNVIKTEARGSRLCSFILLLICFLTFHIIFLYWPELSQNVLFLSPPPGYSDALFVVCQWNRLPSTSLDRCPDLSSCVWNFTAFCFIISQRDVVQWSGLKIFIFLL